MRETHPPIDGSSFRRTHVCAGRLQIPHSCRGPAVHLHGSSFEVQGSSAGRDVLGKSRTTRAFVTAFTLNRGGQAALIEEARDDVGSVSPHPVGPRRAQRRRRGAAAAGRGMSHVDAAPSWPSARESSSSALADPQDALCYLLAFPIWIVSRDLGLAAGAAAGVCALLFVGIVVAARTSRSVPLGTSAARLSSQERSRRVLRQARPNGTGRAKRPSPLLRLLTARPEIMRRARGPEPSRARGPGDDRDGREERRDRRSIRDLPEHRQVARQPDTEEAVRGEPHGGGLPLRRAVRCPLAVERGLAGGRQCRGGGGHASDRRGKRIEGDGVGLPPKGQSCC